MISLLGSLTVLSMPMKAQTDSLQTNTLNPVVVTGTGTYHKANNSPVAVQVISAKEIRDAGVTNLQDALTRLTSSITTHTNGMGTFLNFNGVSDDYILILENGKRVSGDDRWDRLNMSRIKRIEIFSGAASALYGSDALAGVINIITEESREAGVSASSNTQVMNHGRLSQDLGIDVSARGWISRTTYNHRQADGWQVSPYQAFQEGDQQVLKLTGRPMSTAFRNDNVRQKLEYRFSDAWSVYLRGDYYDYLTNRPRSATYFTQKATTDKGTGQTTYSYTEKAAYTYDLHHVSYTYGGGARWNPNSRTYVYLDVYSDNFTSSYDYWATGSQEAYDETRKRTHYTNETLRGIFRLSQWNKLSAGTELVQEQLSSQSDNIEGEHSQTYNLFLQDEATALPWLDAVAGIRYTYNSLFHSNVTGNVGLFAHVGGFRLRASYAGGYHTPSLSQLYATDQAKTAARYTLSNPNLRPEKNDFWKVNAEYSNSWIRVDANAFINQIRDMINYRTLSRAEIEADNSLQSLVDDGWTTLRQRDNIDQATLRGLSGNVKLLLPQGFTLGGGYTFTHSQAESTTLDAKTQQYMTTHSPVDKSVKHVGNVSATWDHTWNTYHLGIRLDGHLQSRRYSSTYGYAPGYGQWDLHTHHSFQLAQCMLEPGVGIENLFNKRDRSYWNSNYSTISPGRAFYVSLRMNFDSKQK